MPFFPLHFIKISSNALVVVIQVCLCRSRKLHFLKTKVGIEDLKIRNQVSNCKF